MKLLVPAINLVWVGLFGAALYSQSNEVAIWFGLWTCGMIGFFVGCAYKTEQHDLEQSSDPWQLEQKRLATLQAHEENWERGHSGWCGRCGAARQA